MYILQNKLGNVIKTVKTKEDRDFYLNIGYIEQKNEEAPKVEGAVKRNVNKRNKANAKRDI